MRGEAAAHYTHSPIAEPIRRRSLDIQLALMWTIWPHAPYGLFEGPFDLAIVATLRLSS